MLRTVCVYAQLLSYIQLFVTPWTVALQAPLSMAFSRQEYWSGVPLPPLRVFARCPIFSPKELLCMSFHPTPYPGKLKSVW